MCSEQVGESARKSFSARFFARANPKLSGSPLAGNKTTGQALLKDTDVSESVISKGNDKDLQSEGSPQLPDLVPSKSPQFKQERKGSLSSKHKSGAPRPSSTPATDILPSNSAKLLEATIEEKAPGCRDESSSDSARRGTLTGDSSIEANTEILATQRWPNDKTVATQYHYQV